MTGDQEAWRLFVSVYLTLFQVALVPALMTVCLLAEGGSARQLGSAFLAVVFCFLVTIRLLKAFVYVMLEIQGEVEDDTL